MKKLLVLVLSAGLLGVVSAHADPKPKDAAVYLVGGAARSINPPAEMIKAGNFFLGGYGLGSGRIANQAALQTPASLDGPRTADGILGNGISTRALAVSDGQRAIVLAQIETQGYFSAYKQGPFGLIDIRRDATAAIERINENNEDAGPAIDAESILVDSNHSHGGPDTVGVWGGVPTEYLKLVHDRTVEAIVAAYRSMRPATLSYGAVAAPDLLSNDFDKDPNNASMDNDVRVFQAKDAKSGKVVATYSNFSAHPTILGGGNHKITADYTGVLSDMIAQTYGGFGFDQVATLGRTHAGGRPGCADRTLKGPDADLCSLRGYAGVVLDRIKKAVANAEPLTGESIVDMRSYLITVPATAVSLMAGSYVGLAAGMPIMRSIAPPWTTGDLIGTSVFSGRIGDVLLTGSPGEPYPQILQKVAETVPARGHVSIGTAGDFLGYIIGPLEAFPEPIKQTVLDDQGNPSPVASDNFAFNAGIDFGERLTCAQLRGAGDVMAHDADVYWSTYQRCLLFPTDHALPEGADLSAPPSPDLSSALT
ncbi:MAG: hypothetical protein JOY57_10705 [Actinobacteria bacterium]|nr:hypothetical protein [Actinomycetota bacterium]